MLDPSDNNQTKIAATLRLVIWGEGVQVTSKRRNHCRAAKVEASGSVRGHWQVRDSRACSQGGSCRAVEEWWNVICLLECDRIYWWSGWRLCTQGHRRVSEDSSNCKLIHLKKNNGMHSPVLTPATQKCYHSSLLMCFLPSSHSS